MGRRSIVWGGGILTIILIVLFVLAYLIDEPLRRRIEREMNARLRGYTVRIEKLDFIRLGFPLIWKNCGFILIFANSSRKPKIRRR